jgi:hypothetical protein
MDGGEEKETGRQIEGGVDRWRDGGGRDGRRNGRRDGWRERWRDGR